MGALNNTDPGNPREEAAKRRGFGFYASHLGRLGPGGYYMKRWILRLPFGFTVRLHHILRSDADRHLHDHPFDFTSFLLTGGYTETTPCDCDDGRLEDGERCRECFGRGWQRRTSRFWPRFSIVRKKADDFHALALERPVLTLVFAGPKKQEWGFWTETGRVHNREYDARWPEHSGSTRSAP